MSSEIVRGRRAGAANTITLGELLEAITEATGLHAQLEPGLAEFALFGQAVGGGIEDGVFLDTVEVVTGDWPNGGPMRFVTFGLRGECGAEVVALPPGGEAVARALWGAVEAAYRDARAS